MVPGGRTSLPSLIWHRHGLQFWTWGLKPAYIPGEPDYCTCCCMALQKITARQGQGRTPQFSAPLKGVKHPGPPPTPHPQLARRAYPHRSRTTAPFTKWRLGAFSRIAATRPCDTQSWLKVSGLQSACACVPMQISMWDYCALLPCISQNPRSDMRREAHTRLVWLQFASRLGIQPHQSSEQSLRTLVQDSHGAFRL